METRNVNVIRNVKVINFTAIASDWISEAMAEGAPFSWGDNDKTLVHSERILMHLHSIEPLDEMERDDLFKCEVRLRKIIEEHPEVFIDLES